MIKAMGDFMRGMGAFPVGWRVWLMALVLVNLVLPIFLFGHVEARWTILAFFIGFMIGAALVKLQGFTRLLGLVHIHWFALVPFLWSRAGAVPAGDLFGFWICAVILLNSVSLIIDAVDVVRYIMGDRKSSI